MFASLKEATEKTAGKVVGKARKFASHRLQPKIPSSPLSMEELAELQLGDELARNFFEPEFVMSLTDPERPIDLQALEERLGLSKLDQQFQTGKTFHNRELGMGWSRHEVLNRDDDGSPYYGVYIYNPPQLTVSFMDHKNLHTHFHYWYPSRSPYQKAANLEVNDGHQRDKASYSILYGIRHNGDRRIRIISHHPSTETYYVFSVDCDAQGNKYTPEESKALGYPREWSIW